MISLKRLRRNRYLVGIVVEKLDCFVAKLAFRMLMKVLLKSKVSQRDWWQTVFAYRVCLHFSERVVGRRADCGNWKLHFPQSVPSVCTYTSRDCFLLR